MTSHTPGPWKVVDTGDRKEIFSTDGDAVLSGLGDWGYEGDLCVSPEDLRLIAAAPELLAACEAMVEAHDDGTRSPYKAADAARAAIAKAKGTTNDEA